MRLFGIATLACALAGLPGCGSTPHDPYANMQMLSPEQAGARQQEEDPVQDAEKAHNGKFAHAEKRKR